MSGIAEDGEADIIMPPEAYLASRKQTDKRLAREIILALDTWIREHAEGRNVEVPAFLGKAEEARVVAPLNNSRMIMEPIVLFHFNHKIRFAVVENVRAAFQRAGYTLSTGTTRELTLYLKL